MSQSNGGNLFVGTSQYIFFPNLIELISKQKQKKEYGVRYYLEVLIKSFYLILQNTIVEISCE